MAAIEHAHGENGGCGCGCSMGLKAAVEVARRAVSRRNLLVGAGTAAIGSWALTSRTVRAAAAAGATQPAITPASELIVQPVLTYATPQRRDKTSWRSWGGIMTEDDATAECQRIEGELRQMAGANKLALRFLPVARVKSTEEAAKIAQTPADAMLVYAAGGGRNVLEALPAKDRPTVFFLRHRSGPVSLYYEIMHPHYLRKATDQYADTGVDVRDVVVDEYADLAWRMKALLALRRTMGTRIVALGGAMGWGEGHKLAPPIARDKWQLDIREVHYDDLGKRIEKARQSNALMGAARKQADAYLAQSGISLHTDRKAVDNAMILCDVFKELMAEHDARAFTIGGCMGTVIPIAETTACLPLSILNDEGYLAFCESDFVVIPSGILMHHLTGTPPFLNDPTWPHHGVVTLAHCTAPRKMDGKTYEPAQIHTHFESDYGAAPKVEMAKGQVVSNVIPDFACQKWVGALGTIEGNPFHDICRAQIDVAIKGDWQKLVEDMRGFHWMTIYGDCLKEVGYAIKHLGIGWQNVSDVVSV